jgi:hypothetical protein
LTFMWWTYHPALAARVSRSRSAGHGSKEFFIVDPVHLHVSLHHMEIFVPNYRPNILPPFFPFPGDSVVFLPQFDLARSSQTCILPTAGPLSRAL